MSLMPVLSIRKLRVPLPANAERDAAVNEVDLDVWAGEIVCVVGESGSGKSMMANAVMGLLASQGLGPVSGRIVLLGEDIANAPNGRMQHLRGSRMGMIFQEPMTALNPTMTIGRQIEEVLRAHTALASCERIAHVFRLMEEVQLPDPRTLRHAYPHQLSGGQRQRVMIAMAIALEPALLIADEPTTALDVTTQAQILALIRNLQRKTGMAVLFITHDFSVVAEIADRVAVMRHGLIVETGTAQQLMRHPHHPYTRALIDAVPDGQARAAPINSNREAVLSVKGLSKVYDTRSFLKPRRSTSAVLDVSFDLWPGEILGIVGESGSGKSTVARCLARLIEPSAGEIRLKGERIDQLTRRRIRPHRRNVQIIFQDPYRSLNPRRRVIDSMIEGLLAFDTPREAAIEQACELARLVGLDLASLDRYPHQFSGGQRQRICIARALAVRPAVLIADEAVSALDVSIQAQVLELLQEIKRSFEIAILFITHDLRVAAQVCNRVLVMKSGKVIESGTIDDVFHRPEQDYTRLLLDSVPGRAFAPIAESA